MSSTKVKLVSIFFILAAAIFATSLSFAAPDLKAGEALSQGLCIACHGPQGKSTNPLWPNLYGQKDQYLFKQLMEFKTGERKMS
jgi:cytochrome c553